MRFLRLVIAEICAALMTTLFFFLLRMLLNELSALPQNAEVQVLDGESSKLSDGPKSPMPVNSKAIAR
jgi:hypothetical protein